MKKTKLLTSLTALTLVLSLGACEINFDVGDADVDADTDETSEPDEGDGNTPEDPDNPNQPESTSETTYSLSITNKEELQSGISNSYDNPTSETYSLDVSLYTYVDGLLSNTSALTSEDVTASSSNPTVVNLSGLDLLLGSQSGEVTLTVSWNEDSTLTDSVTFFYSYTEHQQDLNYTYDLKITNKEELGSTWLTSDGPRTVEFTLTKYTYDGTTLIDTDNTISAESNVELSVTNIASDYDNVVSISGFDVTPAHPGSAALIATWTETGVQDSTELIVEEDYIDGNYSITVNSEEITTGDWYYGDAGRTLSGTLSYTTTAYSDATKVETHTIEITKDNVSIEIKDSEGNTSSVLTSDGLTLIPTGQGTAYVYISWISEGKILATTTFEVTILEPIVPVYKLEILNETELQQAWYLGDQARELEISITPDSATAVEQDVTSLINSGEIKVSVDPSDALDVTTTGGKIYLVPLKAYESITVSVSWTDHEEAFDSVVLALGEHTYNVSITNSDALSTPWSIEEGARTLEYVLYQDGSLLEVETGYIEIQSSDTSLASVEGFNITPKEVGEPTIYLLWYEDSDKTTLLAYDLVGLYINNTIAGVSISLDRTSDIELDYDSVENNSATITATVYGKQGYPATSQAISWTLNGEGVSLSAYTGNTVTITALNYGASATVTATSDECGESVSIGVSVAEQEAVLATFIQDGALCRTVTNPDDLGVYVIGQEDGSSYVTYTGSGFGLTSDYNDAIAVRTILNEGGDKYYLSIDDKYLTATASLVDDINSAYEFSVTESGIESLFIANDGLGTSGSNAYLLDQEPGQSLVPTSSGEYYLRNTHGGVITYFNGSTSSSKLSCTEDINSAATITLTHVSGNAYYMTYPYNGSTYYISVDASDTNVTTNSTAALIYYDSTNDCWQDSTGARYLGGNNSSSNQIIGSYQYSSGALNSSYPAINLYKDAEMPGVKGLTISSTTTELEQGSSFTPNVIFYPSCITLDIDDVTLTQTGGNGTVTITEGSSSIVGASAGSVELKALYNGLYSNTLTIEVTSADTNHLGTYNFKCEAAKAQSCGSNALSASSVCDYFHTSWEGAIEDPLTTVSSAANIFDWGGGSSGDLRDTKGCLRISSSNNAGSMDLIFNDNIGYMEIVAAAYNTSSSTLTINNVGYTVNNKASSSYESDIDSFSVNAITFDPATNEFVMSAPNNNSRLLIFSIALYYQVP